MAMTQRELSLEATRRFFQVMSPAATTFFNPAPSGSVPSDILRLSEIIVANQLEAAELSGISCATYRECGLAAEWMQRQGHGLVVVTVGANGSIAVGGPTATSLDSAISVPAVDTTGAGDAFCAALAVSLAEGKELYDATRFANAAGALACTKHGAYPSMPYRADVEALIEAQGSSR